MIILKNVTDSERSVINMNDEHFIVHIISEICEYAKKNEMIPDETLETVAENIIAMLQICSFNDWCENGVDKHET